MSTVKMSVVDWIEVQDCPIQRDTIKHAAKARHLRKPLPIHAYVSAAKLPTGHLVKLDGHTRAYLWQQGEVEAPPGVTVTVIPVKDMQEALDLYKTFDAKEALETPNDKVSGAFHGIGFQPKSPLLTRGSLSMALRIAWSVTQGFSPATGGGTLPKGADVYRLINEFSAELLDLDSFNLGLRDASTGILAAVLISLRKHGQKVMPFWRAVFNDEGVKHSGRMDAVQACHELIIQKHNYGGSAAGETTARALMAVEKWFLGERFVGIPRALYLTGSYMDADTIHIKKLKGSGRATNKRNED